MFRSAFAVLSFLVLSQIPAHAGDLSVDVRFSNQEIAAITAYYSDQEGTRQKNNGNGNGKSQRLPPGIEKNLARGKQLPPGIARQHLPSDLVLRMPPVKDGYERIVLSGKVLLVETATQVIHDVLTDIVFD